MSLRDKMDISPPADKEDKKGKVKPPPPPSGKAAPQEDDDDDDSDLSDEDMTWIQWFTSLKGNEFFCEVDEDYIQDDFNLTGLSSIVPYYDYALDMILDLESSLDALTDEQQEMIESAGEMLYGLIHARYIITNRGLHAMVQKYHAGDFGRCPRVFCQGQPVLPVGQADLPRVNTVKIFCPKCEDIYYPKSSRHGNIDGAYFGTTFPHLLLQMYPEQIPNRPTVTYTPRIFGFKIHKSSRDIHLKLAAAKKAKQAAK